VQQALKLTEMGFPLEACVAALILHNASIHSAASWLMDRFSPEMSKPNNTAAVSKLFAWGLQGADDMHEAVCVCVCVCMCACVCVRMCADWRG